jgi:hypothetical protein
MEIFILVTGGQQNSGTGRASTPDTTTIERTRLVMMGASERAPRKARRRRVRKELSTANEHVARPAAQDREFVAAVLGLDGEELLLR